MDRATPFTASRAILSSVARCNSAGCLERTKVQFKSATAATSFSLDIFDALPALLHSREIARRNWGELLRAMEVHRRCSCARERSMRLERRYPLTAWPSATAV